MELNRKQIAGILDIIFNKPQNTSMYFISPPQALLLIKIINELIEEVERLKGTK